MAKRKTQEEFVKEVYDLVGDEYTVLGEYKTCKDKILLRHNRCDHEWMIIPNSFIYGSRCPKCNRFNVKTTNMFSKEVYDLVGDEYTVLGEYINNYTKILMRHNKCGHEWMVSPNSFLHGSKCPNHSKNAGRRKTQEQFGREVYHLTKGEYTVLGEYINSYTKIAIRHNSCGNILYRTPHAFLYNISCPMCTKYVTKNNDRFKKDVLDLYGNEYTILGEYINNYTKILMRHNICGNEFYVKPNLFLKKNAKAYLCQNKQCRKERLEERNG